MSKEGVESLIAFMQKHGMTTDSLDDLQELFRRAYDHGLAAGRAEERAAIVAWVRGGPQYKWAVNSPIDCGEWNCRCDDLFADAVEAGRHKDGG